LQAGMKVRGLTPLCSMWRLRPWCIGRSLEMSGHC